MKYINSTVLEVVSVDGEGEEFIHHVICDHLEDAEFVALLAKSVSNKELRRDDPHLLFSPLVVVTQLLDEQRSISVECRDFWERLSHSYEIVDELCDNVLGLDHTNLDYRVCNQYVRHAIVAFEHTA